MQPLPDLLATKADFAGALGDLLVSFTGEHVGEPERLLICLYAEDLLHVDFKFMTLAMFQARVEDPCVLWEEASLLSDAIAASPGHYPPVDPQWIEDRFWVWVHYIAGRALRGELIEAADGLAWLRSRRCLPWSAWWPGSPTGRRASWSARGAHAAGLTGSHPAALSTAELMAALRRSADLYRRLRSGRPGTRGA